MPSTASMLLNFRSCAVFVFESDPRQLEKHRSKGIQFSSPLLSSPLLSRFLRLARSRRNDRSSPMDIFEEGDRIVWIRLIYEFLFSSFVYFRDRSNSKKLVGVENRRGSREGKFAMIRWRVKRKLWFIIQRDLDKFILRSSSSFESYAVSRHLKFENN